MSKQINPQLSACDKGLQFEEVAGLTAVSQLWGELSCAYETPLEEAIPHYEAYLAKLAKHGCSLCCRVDGACVAGVSYYANDEKGKQAYISQIAVARSYRRRGIAELLIHEVCRRARAQGMTSLGLEVLEDNAAARKLYEKLGFSYTGERGAFGLLMALPLEEAFSGTSPANVTAEDGLLGNTELAARATSTHEPRTSELLGLAELQAGGAALLRVFDGLCTELGLRYSLMGGTLLGAVRHKGFIPWDDDVDVCMPRPDFEKLAQAMLGKRYQERYELVGHPGRDDAAMPILRFCDRSILIEDAYFAEPQYMWIDILPMDGFPDAMRASARLLRRATLLRSLITLSYANAHTAGSLPKRVARTLMTTLDRKHILAAHAAHRLTKLACAHPFEESSHAGAITNGRYGIGERLPREGLEHFVQLEFEGERYPAMACWKLYLQNVYGDYMKLPPKEAQVVHVAKAWRVPLNSNTSTQSQGLE